MNDAMLHVLFHRFSKVILLHGLLQSGQMMERLARDLSRGLDLGFQWKKPDPNGVEKRHPIWCLSSAPHVCWFNFGFHLSCYLCFFCRGCKLFFFSWEVVLIHFPPILHFNLGLMCYLFCCPSWFLSALASMKGTLF